MDVSRPVVQDAIVQEELEANEECQFVAVGNYFTVWQEEDIVEILVPDIFIYSSSIGEVSCTPWGGGTVNDARLKGDMVRSSSRRVV